MNPKEIIIKLKLITLKMFVRKSEVFDEEPPKDVLMEFHLGELERMDPSLG